MTIKTSDDKSTSNCTNREEGERGTEWLPEEAKKKGDPDGDAWEKRKREMVKDWRVQLSSVGRAGAVLTPGNSGLCGQKAGTTGQKKSKGEFLNRTRAIRAGRTREVESKEETVWASTGLARAARTKRQKPLVNCSRGSGHVTRVSG